MKYERNPGSLYVALEGSEGCGKTTFLSNFVTHLRNLGNNVWQVKEPGFTPAGAILRKYILEQERPLEEQIDVMMGDRIITQELVVKKALSTSISSVLVSDRSVISNLIYQGKMQSEEHFDRIMKTHLDLPNFIFPDIVLVGQCPVDVIQKRLEARKWKNKDDNNYLDEKGTEFHLALNKHFSEIHKWCPCPVAYVDFNQPGDAIIRDAVNWITNKLPNHKVKLF